MKIWRLSQFSIQAETPGPSQFAERQRLWIWGQGHEFYQQKLSSAFAALDLQPISGADLRSFDWLLKLECAADREKAELESCLQVFKRTLCVETPLDECFALSWHSKPGRPGKPALTALGDLVHLAKSYHLGADSAGSLPAAGLIAEQMVEFMRRHPLYRQSDALVAVLPSNPDKAFDLPQALAAQISEDTGIPFLGDALFKKRRTAQMKYCPSMADKLDNIADSVGVQADDVAGQNLILIDDILESGATLEETARALYQGGAKRICGLVATKTLKRIFR